jgi:type VI secretion system secreted protein Hcp
MAQQFFMTLEGMSQGPIKGSNNYRGHQDEILCHALQHSVYRPYEEITGKIGGQRIHGLLKITKSWDTSSPLLYQAVCTGERMKNVTLKFYRQSLEGQEEHFFTITLTNASIIEVRPVMYNVFEPDKKGWDHLEEISFNYEKIQWSCELPNPVRSEDKLLNL